MATKCSDESVLGGLFLAAYSGNLADVKSTLKNNALSADVADPNKVCDVHSIRDLMMTWCRQQTGSKLCVLLSISPSHAAAVAHRAVTHGKSSNLTRFP